MEALRLRCARTTRRPPASELRAPSWPARRVHENWHGEDLGFALDSLSELLGHAPRRRVVGVNEAGYPRLVERGEGVLQQHLRGLGGIAASLVLRNDRPSELEGGPARLVGVSAAADELPGRLLLDGVVAVAEEVPVPDEVAHVAKRRDAVERLAPQVAHDLHARAPLLVSGEVVVAEEAESQALGLELWRRDILAAAGGWLGR